MRTSTFLAAAACLLAALSCGELSRPESVTDLGFGIATEVTYSSDHLCKSLSLSLVSGSGGDYTLSYVIDSDHTAHLTDLDGDEVVSGGEVSLSTAAPLLLLLPKDLSEDTDHLLCLEVSRGGISRRDTVSFSIENSVEVRMDTSGELDFSRVILTCRMGPAAPGTCTATFHLDGQLLEGLKYLGTETGGSAEVDFARSESYTFELPYILAGEHVLRVEIRSSQGSETSTLTFTEPDRKPVQLFLAYNDITGNLTLRSMYNLLPTTFSVTVDITVRGQVTYRHKQWLGVARAQTEYFTEVGQASAEITPGTVAVPVDDGLLRSLMDAVYARTRTDASNAIGNANQRTVHGEVTEVILAFSIATEGVEQGRTSVLISPSTGSSFPIRYLYREQTWSWGANSTQTLYPAYTVNGREAYYIHSL